MYSFFQWHSVATKIEKSSNRIQRLDTELRPNLLLSCDQICTQLRPKNTKRRQKRKIWENLCWACSFLVTVKYLLANIILIGININERENDDLVSCFIFGYVRVGFSHNSNTVLAATRSEKGRNSLASIQIFYDFGL